MRRRSYLGDRYGGGDYYPPEDRCRSCNGLLCDGGGPGEREGECRRCSPPTCALCDRELAEGSEGPVCDECEALEALEEAS